MHNIMNRYYGAGAVTNELSPVSHSCMTDLVCQAAVGHTLTYLLAVKEQGYTLVRQAVVPLFEGAAMTAKEAWAGLSMGVAKEELQQQGITAKRLSALCAQRVTTAAPEIAEFIVVFRGLFLQLSYNELRKIKNTMNSAQSVVIARTMLQAEGLPVPNLRVEGAGDYGGLGGEFFLSNGGGQGAPSRGGRGGKRGGGYNGGRSEGYSGGGRGGGYNGGARGGTAGEPFDGGYGQGYSGEARFNPGWAHSGEGAYNLGGGGYGLSPGSSKGGAYGQVYGGEGTLNPGRGHSSGPYRGGFSGGRGGGRAPQPGTQMRQPQSGLPYKLDGGPRLYEQVCALSKKGGGGFADEKPWCIQYFSQVGCDFAKREGSCKFQHPTGTVASVQRRAEELTARAAKPSS